MNYIHEATGAVLNIAAIREAHPNMSIPDGADLTGIGYQRIYPAQTIPTPADGEIVVSKPPEKVDGVWREVFALEPAPVFVPQQVTMRQARLELLSRDLLDDVDAVIAVAGRAAQIEWEYASTVARDNPVIAVVQQQQGMTDEQIDDLFREAAKL